MLLFILSFLIQLVDFKLFVFIFFLFKFFAVFFFALTITKIFFGV